MAVAEVASLDVGSSSTAYGQVVRVAGSVQINAVTGTLGVNLGKVDGTIQVNVGKISDTIAIWLTGTSGTIAANIGKVDGTVAVYLHSTGGTLGIDIGKVNDIVAIKAASVPGTIGVNLGKVDGTIQVNVGKIDDVISVRMNSVAGTVGVNLGKQDGTITVKIGPEAAAFVNAFHTASIFTVAGSTSGVSASGVTLVSPSANANFKVFAYSIQTTGIVSQAIRFVNGAGAGQTVFWVPLITAAASSSSPVGANLAVTPPGFLFATGTSTTLAIDGNGGSLVHYSVSYIKESA